MVFIICLIVAIVAIIAATLFERNDHDIAGLISAIIAAPAVIATIIMLIALFITYIECPKTEARWQEHYVALNTRIENQMYYPWDRQQLIEDVQKWNEDLAAQQAAKKNIWIAVFNPESIEGLDKINLERIDCGKTN